MVHLYFVVCANTLYVCVCACMRVCVCVFVCLHSINNFTFSFLIAPTPPLHLSIPAIPPRLKKGERQQQQKSDPIQDIASNLYSRNRVQDLERAKAEAEKRHEEMEAHYEAELHSLRKKYDSDVAQLKASRDERVKAAIQKIFQEVSCEGGD